MMEIGEKVPFFCLRIEAQALAHFGLRPFGFVGLDEKQETRDGGDGVTGGLSILGLNRAGVVCVLG